jgi:hypothetical protein
MQKKKKFQVDLRPKSDRQHTELQMTGIWELFPTQDTKNT